MKSFLLSAVVLALALLRGVGSQPCTQRSGNNDFQRFAMKHIIQETFNRNSAQQWERYLRKYGLWCRVPVQSFVEPYDYIETVCGGGGRRMTTSWSNLCTSISPFLLYDVSFNNLCQLQVNIQYSYVTVACNIVVNQCLPVHFQRNTHLQPSNLPCS